MIAVIYYMITKGWGSFKNTTVYFKAAFTLKCMAGRRGYLGFTILDYRHAGVASSKSRQAVCKSNQSSSGECYTGVRVVYLFRKQWQPTGDIRCRK